MKIITLSEDTLIDGRLCLKGEIVRVEDGFNQNIEKIIQTTDATE